jgi:hypothetical protein
MERDEADACQPNNLLGKFFFVFCLASSFVSTADGRSCLARPR